MKPNQTAIKPDQLTPELLTEILSALESIDLGAIPYKRDMLIPQYAYKKVLAALEKVKALGA